MLVIVYTVFVHVQHIYQNMYNLFFVNVRCGYWIAELSVYYVNLMGILDL